MLLLTVVYLYTLLFLVASTSGFVVVLPPKCTSLNEGPFRQQTVHDDSRAGVIKAAESKINRQILKGTNGDGDDEFDSLDVVLERARQRNKIGLRFTKMQAILSTPISADVTRALTWGDVGLVVASISIGSTGFAIGLVVGKLTAGSLPRLLSPPVLQLWPVVLAILCDQLL